MKKLAGIIAAAVTPINPDLSLDLERLPGWLSSLARRGCHGALLMGTTGEGPSLSLQQRREILRAAGSYRLDNPDFVLLAGTGMTALKDTIELTRYALQQGFDGVVVLPPYYYKSATTEALFHWYRMLIEEAVPEGKWLLGYHFPRMTGVPLGVGLLQQLATNYPGRFAGVKDSSGEAEHLQLLLDSLPAEFAVFPGNDRLLSLGLNAGAAGSITSLTNLAAPLSRRIWDDFQTQWQISPLQGSLNELRDILDQHPTAPAFLKAVLPRLISLPGWQVFPPLTPLPEREVRTILTEIENSPAYHWLQKDYGPTA